MQEVTDQSYTYKETKELLKKEGFFIPTPDLLNEFLRICKSGKIYDGLKNKLDPNKLQIMLEEPLLKREWLNPENSEMERLETIFRKRDIKTVELGLLMPKLYSKKEIWEKILGERHRNRGEWLGHEYYQKRGQMFVTYLKFDSTGNLAEVTELLDPDTLMENRLPGISAEDLIKNPTSQGLPRKGIKQGSLNYQHPKGFHFQISRKFKIAPKVATFAIDYNHIFNLYCDSNSYYSGPSIGVRRMKIFDMK